MEPYRIKRGMDNQGVQILPLKKQSTDISNVVTQGLPREELHPRFSWKNKQQQQQQKQQAGKPWQQKRSWRKKDDEEER